MAHMGPQAALGTPGLRESLSGSLPLDPPYMEGLGFRVRFLSRRCVYSREEGLANSL